MLIHCVSACRLGMGAEYALVLDLEIRIHCLKGPIEYSRLSIHFGRRLLWVVNVVMR